MDPEWTKQVLEEFISIHNTHDYFVTNNVKQQNNEGLFHVFLFFNKSEVFTLNIFSKLKIVISYICIRGNVGVTKPTNVYIAF